jgi:hypothetical protein
LARWADNNTGSDERPRFNSPLPNREENQMTAFVLCWHKPAKVEEVEATRIDKEWLALIAWGRLDVLKIKNGKMCILDSLGRWSRVKEAEPAK